MIFPRKTSAGAINGPFPELSVKPFSTLGRFIPDCANAVLATAGYNFALRLKWFQAALRAPAEVLLRATFVAQSA